MMKRHADNIANAASRGFEQALVKDVLNSQFSGVHAEVWGLSFVYCAFNI